MNVHVNEQEILRFAEKITCFLASEKGQHILQYLKKNSEIFTLQDYQDSTKGVFISYLFTGNGFAEVSLSLETGECLDIISLTPYKLLQAIQRLPNHASIESVTEECVNWNPLHLL